MQKLRESGRITINTATIYNDLKSDDPLACMYALKYCALSKINDINIIKAIVELKRVLSQNGTHVKYLIVRLLRFI